MAEMAQPFRQPLPPRSARLLPWISVLLGSLVTIVPVVASLPLLPPVGLLVLLAWRLLAPLALRLWAPALLGLFDDLVSGQPVGSAMLLWTLASLLVQALDARSGVRDFLQRWGIAAVAIALCLVGGRLIASPLGAHVDTVLVLQVVVSILLFPLVAFTVTRVDARRGL